MAKCRRKLWETKRDIRSLEATGDVPYIMSEALSINGENYGGDDVTIDTLHSLFKLDDRCLRR